MQGAILSEKRKTLDSGSRIGPGLVKTIQTAYKPGRCSRD